jgi:hypothetical protein
MLSDAGPRDHIVQLYQDQQFLNRAVCRFAAAALANGEGVILVPTISHLVCRHFEGMKISGFVQKPFSGHRIASAVHAAL